MRAGAEVCGAIRAGRTKLRGRPEGGAIPPAQKTHFVAIIDPIEMGYLLRAIDRYSGHFSTICGLRLAPLLFMRPGELRLLESALSG